MRKINEIFYSLQGEGFHTGTPAVFIRFSGCNLKCSFCDTQHEEFHTMTDDALHAAGKYIAIETNGTCVLPEDIDWVTCSPKEGTTLKIRHIDEVKVVYVGQDVSPYLKLPAKHYFLQPCSGQNTDKVIAYIKEHPQWRLSLQTHKLINIP